MPYPLVDQYNDISRLRLKLPFFITNINKDEISSKLRIQPHDTTAIKQAKLQLCAALIAFKYYRQSEVENPAQQEQFLQKVNNIITKKPGSDLNLSLFDCMAYVKNDGFIVQRKITGHFREVLESLGIDDRITLNNYIGKLDPNPIIIERIRKFLFENIGIGSEKIKPTHINLTNIDKNERKTFLNACKTLEFKDPQWLDYMQSEELNPLVWSCINADKIHPAFNQPIQPKEAVEALNEMNFNDFLMITKHADTTRSRNNYGFTENFIILTGNIDAFREVKKDLIRGKDYRGDHQDQESAHGMAEVRHKVAKSLIEHFLTTIVAKRNQPTQSPSLLDI